MKRLLAKLYLNANAWTGVAKWDEAANAAEAVISMGHYTLSPDYFSNFAVQNVACGFQPHGIAVDDAKNLIYVLKNTSLKEE